MIKQLGESYEVVRTPEHYFVGFLPLTIVIYGTCGEQMFNNKMNYSIAQLKQFSPHYWVLRDNAKLHKEGLTNKDKFLVNAKKLVDTKKISQSEHNILREFIQKCDCSPSRVREKLKRINISNDVISALDFEDRQPIFDSTLRAMAAFLEEYYATHKI